MPLKSLIKQFRPDRKAIRPGIVRPRFPGDEVSLLGFDTASHICSVAVWHKGEVEGEIRRPMQRGQAEALMPFIEESLSRAGLSLAALDGIVTTCGPGSFTGIRVGLATARALGLARSLPVCGISSLKAVAAGVSERDHQGRNILVALDSKRVEVFAQIFSAALEPLTEPLCVPARHLIALSPPGPVVLAGNAEARIMSALATAPFDCFKSSAPGNPDAGIMLGHAAPIWASGDLPPPEPLYLRAPDARRSVR